MTDNISFKDKERLLDFAKLASRLGNKLLLETDALTPVNFEQEKEKFFESKTYNPVFKYRRKDLNGTLIKISFLHEKLNRLNLPLDLRKYLKKYLNNLYHLYVAFEAIGTDNFSHAVRVLFNWDFENIKNIKKTLPKISLKTSKAEPKNATEIKKRFKDYLEKKYGIADYQIVIDDFNDHTIRVRSKDLKIGKEVKRNINNINRLLVHELETHVLQKHNIAKSQNPLLELLIYKDWWLYAEGLAVYYEFKTNTITKSAYDIYKARLEAVENSSKSFRQVYNHLLNFVSEDKAYLTTYRLKRGLSDTSRPGGFTKDAVYLLGYVKIKELERKSEDIEKLHLYRVPRLGKLLLKYNLLATSSFILPKFIFAA